MVHWVVHALALVLVLVLCYEGSSSSEGHGKKRERGKCSDTHCGLFCRGKGTGKSCYPRSTCRGPACKGSTTTGSNIQPRDIPNLKYLPGTDINAGHEIFSFYASPDRHEYCPRYHDARVQYCESVGYTCSFETLKFTPQLHFQEALGMRMFMAQQKLQSQHVKQLTYMDADTFILPSSRGNSLEKLFREHTKHHDFPCTVLVQADPFLINSGFFSIVNTHWTRHVFIPLWVSIYNEWAAQKATWLREPDQKSLVAAISKIASEVHGVTKDSGGGDFCRHDKLDKHSPEWDALTEKVTEWVETKGEHNPPKPYWMTSQKGEGHVKTGSYRFNHRRKPLEKGALIYYCFNYLMQEVLGKKNYDYSFRVSDTDGVCFLGFGGKQFNRQHTMPPSAKAEMKDFNASNHQESLGRHSLANPGDAYSSDLFMLHAHLEKLDTCFCITDDEERKRCNSGS